MSDGEQETYVLFGVDRFPKTSLQWPSRMPLSSSAPQGPHRGQTTVNKRAPIGDIIPTWRGMGSARLYFAQDSPCDDNTRPYHTGYVAARVNKDRAFRRTPGWRCQVCYWCIIDDSRKRQHHHRHLEHKDTKGCRETSGTNTRNGQVQMEHPWTL